LKIDKKLLELYYSKFPFTMVVLAIKNNKKKKQQDTFRKKYVTLLSQNKNT